MIGLGIDSLNSSRDMQDVFGSSFDDYLSVYGIQIDEVLHMTPQSG